MNRRPWRRVVGLTMALLPLALACAPAPEPAAPAPPAPPAAPAGGPPTAPAGPPTPDVRAIEAFYKGKTMRIVVGSAPGGGYDTYARLIARHMPRHIPGEPTIVVDNMPGAASLIAANHVYRVAEKDGTVIASVQGGLFLQQLFGLEGVEFEALKWQMLGAPAEDRALCVVTAKSGFTSLADAIGPGRQIVLGGNAPGSATWDTPMRLKAALDLNVKMVAGYPGTAQVRLAMDRGEVDGMCGWAWESVRATGLDKVEAGEYRIISQVMDEPIAAKELEKVQMALSLAKNEDARQLIRLGIAVPSKVLRPYMVAAEVPADRVQVLRQAFLATLKDSEFLQEAEKAKLDIDPTPGEDLQRAVRDLFGMPESIKAKLKQINDAG